MYRKTSQSKRSKKDHWTEDAVGPGTYEINKFAKVFNLNNFDDTNIFSFFVQRFY